MPSSSAAAAAAPNPFASANASRAAVTIADAETSTTLLPKRSIVGPTTAVETSRPMNNTLKRSPCCARSMPRRSRMAGSPNNVPSIAMIMPKTNIASAAARNSRPRVRGSVKVPETLMKSPTADGGLWSHGIIEDASQGDQPP